MGKRILLRRVGPVIGVPGTPLPVGPHARRRDRGVAQDALQRRVAVYDAALAVGDADADRHLVQHAAELRLARAERVLRQRRLGDVTALDEDAADRARRVTDGLKDEVHEAPVGGAVRIGRKRNRRTPGGGGLSGRINLVQQLEEALSLDLRQGFSHRPAHHLTTDEGDIRGVCQLEDVVGSAQQGDETGCLLEEPPKPLGLVGLRLLHLHLCGHVAADHQHAADAGRCGLVIDRRVAVRPPDVLAHVAAGDGNELPLVPGRALPCHDELDLRADGVPDLRPDLSPRTSERRGMAIRPDQGAVGVVVEAGKRFAPPDEHWVLGGEHQAHDGLERLRPRFRRPDRRLRPIVSAHERAHLAATGEEAGACGAHQHVMHARQPCPGLGLAESNRTRLARSAPCGQAASPRPAEVRPWDPRGDRASAG